MKPCELRYVSVMACHQPLAMHSPGLDILQTGNPDHRSRVLPGAAMGYRVHSFTQHHLQILKGIRWNPDIPNHPKRESRVFNCIICFGDSKLHSLEIFTLSFLRGGTPSLSFQRASKCPFSENVRANLFCSKVP